MTDESQRVAVVTGAGAGIGRVTALALLDAGFRVVLCGPSEEQLQHALCESRGNAERGLVLRADVSCPESVEELFSAVSRRFGRLDLLFNNAGVGAPALPLEDLSLAAWRRVIDTNLTGAFLCTQQAFRLMKRQTPRGGRIVNNGSIAAHVPRPFSVAYTASKHGMTGLTRAAALDGRPFDIAVTQLDIGNAATELTARMPGGVLQADGSVQSEPVFDARHVADIVVSIARLPVSVSVLSMTVLATKMPYVGRG